MKFIIDRELLLTTLQNVSKGLSQKTPMPVLTGIQIAIHNGKITFITTNKEISVRVRSDLLNVIKKELSSVRDFDKDNILETEDIVESESEIDG